jgi:hypothetical protein
MQTKVQVELLPKNTSLLDLKSFILDTKREQYLFQSAKDVVLKWHEHTSLAGR